jgi:AcrR family transcriptional regulator
MATKSNSKSRQRRRAPGRPRSGERSPEGSRARLLNAAEEVFARRGYERATVDEIATQAGLSKGTVYWNFASKEELFLALLEERFDRPAEAIMEMSRSTPREQPSAQAVDAAVTQLVRDHPQTFHLLLEYWGAAARDPRLRERYRERQRRLRDTLAGVMRARQPPDIPFAVEPEHLATAFNALAVGLALEMLIDPDTVPEGLFGEILSLAYDGNAARGGRLP